MISDLAILVSHQERCRALLEARGTTGADTAELSDPTVGGHEGPRRVRELREMGYPIQRERLPSGYWRYWLGPPPPTAQLDLLWEE